MASCGDIRAGLKATGYPIRFVVPSDEWIEATFQLPGGTVTLALPPSRATAGEFAFLFDMAVGGREAD